MKKPRNYISFRSLIQNAYWYTQIDLIANTMRVSQEDKLIFKGSFKEFKALEKIKADHLDEVYAKILDMSEELINLLSQA